MLAIEGLCRRLERQQARMLAALEALSREQTAFRPSAQAWSTTQVLQHVLKTERSTTLDLHRSLTTPGAAITNEGAERARKLIHWLLSRERVHVPEFVGGPCWPDDGADFDEIVAEWREVRRSLVTMARSHPATGGALIFHPSTGAMDMVLALRYLHAHTRHHEHQLKRLRDAHYAFENIDGC